MKKVALFLLKIYQKYISKFTPASCRYYPTCSEYAVWQIKNNNIFLAIYFSAMRILRCNQFFKGGIDYPVIKKKFTSFSMPKGLVNIDFWFVPCNEGKFYVIKVLDSLKEKR